MISNAGGNDVVIRLFAITDAERFPDFLLQSEALCASAKEGTLAIVLREYGASGQKQFEWAKTLREVTARWGQKLFIADRADLAELVGADGVHLPAAGLAPRLIRDSSRLAVSRSGHHLEALLENDWRRLSAVWVSPVGAAKKGRAALGEAGLREKVEWIKSRAPHVAVYALGGVTGAEVPDCFRAGASGVAAIGAAFEATEREALTRALQMSR